MEHLDDKLVRVNTLKAGQLIQTTKGRIYVLVQMVDVPYEGVRIEIAECGRKKIDTVRSMIDPNTMVTPVEADFFVGSDCVHRTYKDEDSNEELVVMPSDPRTGTPHQIRRCIGCKRTIPNSAGISSRCKGCARSYRKQHSGHTNHRFGRKFNKGQ